MIWGTEMTVQLGLPGITAMVANVAGGVCEPRRSFVILLRGVPVAISSFNMYQYVLIGFNYQ